MGLPLDALIAGVYVLIDMPNTMLNVTGDSGYGVQPPAGELDRETFDRPKVWVNPRCSRSLAQL